MKKLFNFKAIWVLFLMMGCAALLAALGHWGTAKVLAIITLVLFAALLILKPMNAVYGLIGTKGSISLFIGLFVIINILFGTVYYFGFLKNAGITYDTNQPYISFNMFRDSGLQEMSFVDSESESKDEAKTLDMVVLLSRKTDVIEKVKTDTLELLLPDGLLQQYLGGTHTYHRFDFESVVQNTLLTSLMQEPSNLFSNCAAYNDIECSEEQDIDTVDGFDKSMSRMFSWLMILQVFISWIFLGVLISILYNKFRYES